MARLSRHRPGKKFLGSLKLLASTTDKAPNLKRALSAALRGAEKVIEAVGGESATLKALGGHPETNPLGETYFSQAPILYGAYMAKVLLAPVAAELRALTDAPVAAHRPIGAIMRLRKAADAMSARFRMERTGVSLAEPNDMSGFPST